MIYTLSDYRENLTIYGRMSPIGILDMKGCPLKSDVELLPPFEELPL